MKVYNLILFIVMLLILIFVITVTLWKLDEARCYNMPLNEVYNDKLCQLHTETYEELNRR